MAERIRTELRLEEIAFSKDARVLVDLWMDDLLLTSYLVFSGPAWKARELYKGNLRFTKDSKLVHYQYP